VICKAELSESKFNGARRELDRPAFRVEAEGSVDVVVGEVSEHGVQ
jgi:hypothetical protein